MHHTWDLPLCVGLLGLAVTLRPLLGDPPAGWRMLLTWLTWPRVRGWFLALALPVVGAYPLPAFHIAFQNSVSGIGRVTTPTDPVQFLIIFGLWMFITASFFFVELRDWWERRLALDARWSLGIASPRRASGCYPAFPRSCCSWPRT